MQLNAGSLLSGLRALPQLCVLCRVQTKCRAHMDSAKNSRELRITLSPKIDPRQHLSHACSNLVHRQFQLLNACSIQCKIFRAEDAAAAVCGAVFPVNSRRRLRRVRVGPNTAGGGRSPAARSVTAAALLCISTYAACHRHVRCDTATVAGLCIASCQLFLFTWLVW